MRTAPHAEGIGIRPAFTQRKRYADMIQHTDIEELDLEDEELTEDECRRLFESHLDENGVYILTPEQRARIELSRQQIARGECISHEDFMKELDAWLGKE